MLLLLKFQFTFLRFFFQYVFVREKEEKFDNDLIIIILEPQKFYHSQSIFLPLLRLDFVLSTQRFQISIDEWKNYFISSSSVIDVVLVVVSFRFDDADNKGAGASAAASPAAVVLVVVDDLKFPLRPFFFSFKLIIVLASKNTNKKKKKNKIKTLCITKTVKSNCLYYGWMNILNNNNTREGEREREREKKSLLKYLPLVLEKEEKN